MNASQESCRQKPRAGDYVIASKVCELKSLEHFLQMGKLIQCISSLVHGLQRERGASNVFLGSEGKKFAAERVALVAESEGLAEDFEQALSDIHEELTGHPVSSRLLNRIALALHGLEGMSAFRRSVESREVSAADATEEYSVLIQNLIAVVFEAADMAVDPTIAGMLVAMVHLMNGKELCGQERAAGSAGFSAGGFDRALKEHMAHLVEAQERCFEVFSSFADPDSLWLWEQVEAHSREEEISRLRRLATSSAPSATLDTALADQWFTLMTERIDALKHIEDSVEGGFHARCTERYGDARNSLAHQETLIASLDAGKPNQSPMLVVCDTGQDKTTGPAFSGDGVGQEFGRSIFDLVKEQSSRLQQMSDELQGAREALEDRKIQEKAVLLLMEHRKISNDEAHRVLRKLAMNQGKKLPDVARSLLSMADVLK
jgi:hypothetical protein